MTERLSQLMRDEADVLEIPHPRHDAILFEGRRQRRRKRLAPMLAATAAAAVLVLGTAVVLPRVGSQDRSDDGTVAVKDLSEESFSPAEAAAARDAYARGGAFAIGSTVYFGGSGEYGVRIDDPAVRGVYYTSVGVLVRHGKDYVMDGSGREGYSLVGTDGSVTGLDLELGDVSPSTDPKQPYFAYARPGTGEGEWDVVVLDLRSGEPAAVVPVDGAFTWGGWSAPPVALSGDRVYVGLDDAIVAVDWRSGDVTSTPLPSSTYPDINADRYLETTNGISVRVRDALSGDTLLDVPIGDRFASLSPDGEHALVLPYMTIGEGGQIQAMSGAVLHAVDSGKTLELPPSPVGGYGWTPDGLVFSVAEDGVTLCDVDAGCSTTPLGIELPDTGLETIRIGGMVNEA